MASVKITDYETRNELLPAMCIMCGGSAVRWQRRTLSWFSPIIFLGLLLGVLPFLITVLIFTKRKKMSLPVCIAHRRDWSGFYKLCATAMVVQLIALAFILRSLCEELDESDLYDLRVACVTICVTTVATLLVVIHLSSRTLRAREIKSGRWIRLLNVSPTFVDALKEDRVRDRHRFQAERARRLARESGRTDDADSDAEQPDSSRMSADNIAEQPSIEQNDPYKRRKSDPFGDWPAPVR
jgi:hypothetical protein